MNPTIDPMKLTPEQRDRLESYQQIQDQLQVLQDIAMMTQEVINLMDDQKKGEKKTVSEVGALLIDMRDSLVIIKDKQPPEIPDYAKPIVEAVKNLEKALNVSIKSIDVKPNIKIPAPEVNVAVDLSGIEKAVKQIPKAFDVAINKIPKVEIPKTDFQPLLDAWEGISEQLESIETATRMKPQFPTTLKVTNPDGTSGLTDAQLRASPVPTTSGSLALRYDEGATYTYIGEASPGTATSSALWRIKRLTNADNTIVWIDGNATFDNVWDDRAVGVYS